MCIRDSRKRAEMSLRGSNTLLNAISRTQALYIAGADAHDVFEHMLTALLEMTGSEYGFIGEVLRDQDGIPYLRTQAITNIAWSDETRAFYAAHAPQGMEFRNLTTLFGAVMTTAQPVIANDPSRDSRGHGVPPGHPSLNAFMGLPFFRGDELVGMVGVCLLYTSLSDEVRRAAVVADRHHHRVTFPSTGALTTSTRRESTKWHRPATLSEGPGERGMNPKLPYCGHRPCRRSIARDVWRRVGRHEEGHRIHDICRGRSRGKRPERRRTARPVAGDR